MAEPISIHLIGELLLHLCGPEHLKEYLRRICEILQLNPDIPVEDLVKKLNEEIQISENVVAILNYNDQTLSRRKQIS